MKQKLSLLSAVTGCLFVASCANGPWQAPPGTAIGEIEDIKVAWFACPVDPITGAALNPSCNLEQPSPPVIFPLTIYLVNEDTESPVNNVWVEITSGFEDVYLLPQEVIEAVIYPDTENWQDVATSDEIWAQFSGTFEGDYRPTYLQTYTDQYGMAKLWVWVQRMPIDTQAGTAKESSILIDIGVARTVITLQAGA
ncbi:MAG: hypothetical protein GY898_11435 [Proteobacteria bacterium]|nr:hypothetical protein [Pseudomonadota bacterium]